MSDLISREMAIGVVGRRCGTCIQGILDIPTAQPEKRTAERTETYACDCISRQAAISVIAKWMLEYGGEGEERERNVLKQAAEEINELPSAQPEIIRCKDCKNSEHWYRDRRRCFLWAEDGVSVFDNGFCNYAERR